MRDFLQILSLGRHHVGRFTFIAFLVSVGTLATLLEPWIYRAIIDDIAGVFVTSQPLLDAETWLERLFLTWEHIPGGWARMFTAPLGAVADAGSRVLEGRSVPQAMATVVAGALLLIVLRLFAEWVKLLADNRVARIASELERGFILRTFGHVLRLPLSFFSKRSSGSIARQIDQSDNVAPIFTAAAQEFWPDFFRVTAILAVLLVANRELAAIGAVGLVAYGIVSWRSSRRLDAELDRYYGLWDDASSHIQQVVAGIKTVQTHGNEAHEAETLDRLTGVAYDAYLRRTRLVNRYAYAQDAIVCIAKASVLGLGGLKAIEHQLTPGDVVMFLAYLDRLFAPVENLTGLYSALQQHVASVRRAQRLLAQRQADGGERPPVVVHAGDVAFENVTFGYAARHPVLKGVSFHLRSGERTALVGPSGAGKTTVSDLLVGLYAPQTGRIVLDGQDIATVAPWSLRHAVRGVAADGTLFRMSIRDNIRYGRLDATDADVTAAAALAGLDGVVERLDDGLDTLVGERGVELSVGERQRLLLARAFLARPSVLVLDEATANLDFRTEASVKEALAELSRGRTTLLIAHRRSMVTDVDRVIVLRDGRIEQDGSPLELQNRPGYFQDMLRASENA